MNSDYVDQVKTIHIELTDNCQASCPQCPRNISGGPAVEFVGRNEIRLKDFQGWFPASWLTNLDRFYACGNYGDPLLARDCLEIFRYVRESSPTTFLGLHTNASLRDATWWKNLAKVMSSSARLTIGIDGLGGQHELYRKGTNFNRIMRNADAFINAGGIAVAACIVFKHNQDNLSEIESTLLSRGFKEVIFKTNNRFNDKEHIQVYDDEGNPTHILERTTLPDYRGTNDPKWTDTVSSDENELERWLDSKIIDPSCRTRKEIYVDSAGHVWPCCYIGEDMVEIANATKDGFSRLRSMSISRSKAMFSAMSLRDSTIMDVLGRDPWQSAGKTCENITCAIHCGKKKSS